MGMEFPRWAGSGSWDWFWRAGGMRLGPLTAGRATSAVPFGGLYRVVDFTLSNLVNGGLQRIYVLTQYKSHSLNRHITTTWRRAACWTTTSRRSRPSSGSARAGRPAADAIYQSLNLIYPTGPTSSRWWAPITCTGWTRGR